MKTVTRIPIMLTDDRATVMLTGVYFIDFRKKTKPKAHTRHKTIVLKKSPNEKGFLIIPDTSVLDRANVSQSKPKNKEAIIPLNNTR